VWPENVEPGVVTKLAASDNDSDKNGPPFHFELDPAASDDIRSSFKVTCKFKWMSNFAQTKFLCLAVGNTFQVETIRTFDREEQKTYFVPIAISDAGVPSQTGTSTLTVIIGDENDNPMQSGHSEIFVYNYKVSFVCSKANSRANKLLTLQGLSSTAIGRVFVEDLDDWDLPDKTFGWKSGGLFTNKEMFNLDEDTGEISVNGDPEGTYDLEFTVRVIFIYFYLS